ncbi:hypothetical protein [Paenibacillus sp. FSL R7-0337]|nr:hypothetical protein [Paenibacillus sp. FSL R7-0337]
MTIEERILRDAKVHMGLLDHADKKILRLIELLDKKGVSTF